MGKSFPCPIRLRRAAGQSWLFWQAKAVPGKRTHGRWRRRSPSEHLHFLAEMKAGSGGRVRADQASLEAAFGGGPIATGDMATRFRTIRLRLARSRRKSLPPRGIARFQRRGTKWRHNTSRVDPAHRKISLGPSWLSPAMPLGLAVRRDHGPRPVAQAA
jgi:hypothetical protein